VRGKALSITIEAIYEAGILKPLAPLPKLADKSRVRVAIEPAGKPAPKVRRSPEGATDYSRLREWLGQNREKYRGRWIMLDQDRLIGHTANPNEAAAIIQRSRDEGVRRVSRFKVQGPPLSASRRRNLRLCAEGRSARLATEGCAEQ
jgi:predicted DNA-binding antitoxin AbrB/MazE fold protein